MLPPQPGPAGRQKMSTAVFTVSGTISYVNSSSYFTMKTAQCGYLHVYYGSTTAITYNGLKIAAGTPAQAAGSGSCSTSITASSIVLGTSPTPTPTPTPTPSPAPSAAFTVSGTISYVNSSTSFTMKTTQGGYLHVNYSPATVITYNGLAIAAGTPAQASGSGSCSTSITASSIVLGSAPAAVTIPQHLLTSDYMRDSGTTQDVIYPVATYAKYLSFTDTTPDVANQFAATGVKTMFYNDPNRVESGYPMYTATESAYAHDCSGNRIYATNYPSLMLMNPASSDTVSLWKSTSETILSEAHFDYIFEDDVNDVYAIKTLPCGYSSSAWLTASENEVSAMPFSVIYNDLNMVDANYDMPVNLAFNSITPGGMMENCYVQTSSSYPKASTGYWLTTENVELTQAANKKLFFCYSGNTTQASTTLGLDLRNYMIASFLLTYDPGTSVLWQRFWMHSNFRVQPESGLVPLDPLEPEPSSISSLQVAGGAYEREYAHCYLNGTYVSACAIAVNPSNTASVTDPLAASYHHTMVLSGGGVLDGGTVSTIGGAPPSQIAAEEAVVAFP